MSIDYSPVIGVGVDIDEITYESLTDYAKQQLLEWFEQTDQYKDIVNEYCGEDGEWLQSHTEIIQSALEDFYEEVKMGNDFLYELGLDEREANYFSGWYGNIGVSISLNIETIKEDVAKAVEEFKKVVNLEPVLFTGVLVS